MRRRRAALLALALLVVLPLAPARAADPLERGRSPIGTPATTPTPTPAEPVVPGTTPQPGTPGPGTSPSAEPALHVPATGIPDADGRYLVLLDATASVAAAAGRAARLGIAPDRTFGAAVRGFAARMTPAQAASVASDPSVVAVVEDEVVSVAAQSVPVGVQRIGGVASPAAVINGVDTRVDADVAIVDTGIDATHPDLAVAGGYNCSTSDTTAWRDLNNHGTHVAGTVGAIDNGIGVVGVAPGVRLWAVKILNDDGFGLLSWYVCGLDWIAAQRDPANPALPRFEAVNMSVAKPGRDDKTCGVESGDILHAAICRLVSSGVTVVAAAGNETNTASLLVPAAYDEVITVSALADTDGRPGGLGGNLCYSWGTYDKDDTLADFSNYGWDVDLIAPGKCIWSTLPGNRYGYSSGTSMAAPHVTGAVALYKATRPLATPAQVKAALLSLGSMDWNTATDRDSYHEPLLDVSRIAPLGDYAVTAGPVPPPVPESGATLSIPVSVSRSEHFFETVTLDAAPPSGLAATLSTTDLAGAAASATTLTVTVPPGTPAGTYPITITARNWDRVRTTTATVSVLGDAPRAPRPTVVPAPGARFDTDLVLGRVTWVPAVDLTSGIAAYEVARQEDDGAWSDAASLPGTSTYLDQQLVAGHRYTFRLRARDTAGNWSAWSTGDAYTFSTIQDGSPGMTTTGPWAVSSYALASGGSTRYSATAGASMTATVSGDGVAIVAPLGPTRGSARIYLDGVLAETISLYRSTGLSRQVVFTRGFASQRTVTVTIVVVGTPGRPRVDIDAVVLLHRASPGQRHAAFR